MRDPPPRVRQITVHPLTMLPRSSLWSERCCSWTTFVMVDACLGTWSERPVPFVLVRSLFSAQLASNVGWSRTYRLRTMHITEFAIRPRAFLSHETLASQTV